MPYGRAHGTGRNRPAVAKTRHGVQIACQFQRRLGCVNSTACMRASDRLEHMR
ncbi:MAG: hypothetical protein OJF55_000319 [Rhodanobacteraceae bacterium]|nr:MAG: hypothetical protein OJF55_000319 [Rhodanobacteraceae bacterium]